MLVSVWDGVCELQDWSFEYAVSREHDFQNCMGTQQYVDGSSGALGSGPPRLAAPRRARQLSIFARDCDMSVYRDLHDR